MNNKKSDHSIFDKLKLNSWEVEILIVGFLLVVLLQIPESIINEIHIAKINVDVITSFSKAISTIGIYLTLLFATKIITITLSVYIILRSFWVVLLGLSSVFPEGINIKKIKYNKYFMNKINSYDLDVSINQVDKISSTIFSFRSITLPLKYG